LKLKKLRHPFTALALDVLSTSIFGIESKALNPLKIEEYKKGEIPETVSMTLVDSLLNIIKGLVVNYLLTKKIARSIPFGFFAKSSKSVEDFISYGKFILEKSRIKKPGSDDSQDGLVQMMIKSQEGETSIKLTDEELISNMFIFFFAGHETTAGTLHWAMLCLAENPKVQEKLFQEVSEVLQGRSPTYEDFPKLKYAFSVFKETLRVHSPVKATVKTNITPVTLANHTFEKDTVFGLFFPGVHKDPKIWKNPEEFQPERFMENYNSSQLLSFSFGKRNCIGSKFAEVEGTVILCVLIQQFSIHLKEGVDIQKYKEEVTFVTTTPKYDIPFVLKKRK
jgi:cytochrome P450